MADEGTNWADFFNRQGIAYFTLVYRMPQGDRTPPSRC
jgi:LPS sulfotransferase NodH